MLQRPSCCRQNSIYVQKTGERKILELNSRAEQNKIRVRDKLNFKSLWNTLPKNITIVVVNFLIVNFQISIQNLEVSLRCRRIDFNVGESTQIVQAKRLRSCRRNDLDVGESTCRRNDWLPFFRQGLRIALDNKYFPRAETRNFSLKKKITKREQHAIETLKRLPDTSQNTDLSL